MKIHHFFLLKAQSQSLQNSNFGDISPYHNFKISFRVILLLSRETDMCLVLMADTKYVVWLSFPGSPPKFN